MGNAEKGCFLEKNGYRVDRVGKYASYICMSISKQALQSIPGVTAWFLDHITSIMIMIASCTASSSSSGSIEDHRSQGTRLLLAVLHATCSQSRVLLTCSPQPLSLARKIRCRESTRACIQALPCMLRQMHDTTNVRGQYLSSRSASTSYVLVTRT